MLLGSNADFPCQYALRQTARPLTPPQMTRLVSTELSVLHQLIQLLNCTHTQYPEIMEKVKYKTGYNVKEKYLVTYVYECTYIICY